MRRLVPFLLAAAMAMFPPSLLLIFMGGPAGPACSHTHSVGVGGGVVGDVPVVTGVAHAATAYVYPSHYPMVATTASIVASTMSGSGGKRGSGRNGRSGGGGGGLIQTVSATEQRVGGGTPRQLQPAARGQPMQQQTDYVAASTPDNQSQGGVGAEAPPDTLKVSVLGASRGKSAECTHSLVEFSNTHHTDTIVVHSTYIEPTAVFTPATTDLAAASSSSDIHQTVWQQRTDMPGSPAFHGEYYEDRQLRIPPRTAVTIPVSIIPHWRKPPDLDQESHKYRNRMRYRKLDEKEGSSSFPQATHPSTGSDSNTTYPGGEFRNSYSNPAVHADLLDMMDDSRHDISNPNMSVFRFLDTVHDTGETDLYRSSMLESSSIHETLIANTSWGFVQMKVPYVCSPHSSKEYEFGLPNNIMFLDGGGGWYARRNTTPTVELSYLFGDWKFNPTRDNLDPFIYRVYMNNPTSRDLKIWEVYTTKPEIVGVETQKYHSTCPREESGSSMAVGDHLDPFNRIRRVYPPKMNNIYVATLRLHQHNFALGTSSSIQDLGFLAIHTSVGAFSIALDFIPNAGRGGVIHGVADNLTMLDNVHLVQDDRLDSFLWEARWFGEPPRPNMTIAKSYRARNADDMPSTRFPHPEMFKVGTLTPPLSTWNRTSSYIKTAPSQINFGAMTTGSRTVRIPLGLVNIHDKPLHIKRITVAMSTTSDDGLGNVTDISDETSRMEIGIELKDNGDDKPIINITDLIVHVGGGTGEDGKRNSFLLLHDLVVPAYTQGPTGERFEYPIYVWCRFNADEKEEDDTDTDVIQAARFYTGSIVIHAYEDSYMPYWDWELQQMLNHSSGGEGPWLSPPSEYITEVPFSGSVLPGNIGSPTESLLFPTQFFVLPVEERLRIMSQQSSSISNGKIPEYYDRELDITNNFAVPISITRLSILDSNTSNSLGRETQKGFCQSRFSTQYSFDNVRTRSPNLSTALEGEKWKGLTIRYYFREDDADFYLYGDYKKCILSIETDRAGRQSLPLIIYNGDLMVDVERPEGGSLTVHCLVTTKEGDTVVSKSGMPCMKDWIGNTREGVALQTSILEMAKNREKKKGSFRGSSRRSCAGNTATTGDGKILDQVEHYFRSLLSSASKGSSEQQQAIQPVVLSLGAIETGESMSRSIQLTNMNHASIKVTATSASVGNMSVRVGIVPNPVDLADQIAQHGMKQGHDMDGIIHFFQHSQHARKFFDKFQYKLDIGPSPRAAGSELLSLYERQATMDAFHNATEYLANYIDLKEKKMDCTRGFMVAADGTYSKEFKSRKVGKKSWTIPPGGVARFLVTVKAPSRSELENDVTPFVGSGLVLETNHGQAFPVVVTYSAIAGHLQLIPDDDANVTTHSELIDDNEERQRRLVAGEELMGHPTPMTIPSSMMVEVPLTFKDPTLTPSVDNFAQRKGVSLTIESTFVQDVYLSEIRSCNKWFNVFLPSNNPAAREFFSKQGPNNYLRIRGTKSNELSKAKSNTTMLSLGKVLSALSCSHPSGDTSFYACALAWLENRDTLQPPGCGWSEEIGARQNNTQDTEIFDKISTAKTNAIGALRDVVAFLSVRYVDAKNEDGSSTSGKGSDGKGGYIHFSRIHMFEHARKMWNEVVSLKLNTITGHINAKTVFFTDITSGADYLPGHTASDESAQRLVSPLSIPVSSVLLLSTLDIPKLFWDQGSDGSVAQTAKSDSQNDIGIVDFGTVHVADTAIRYVPISNPTAMTIRIRLAAIDSLDGSFGKDTFSQKNVFVQGGPSDTHTWWTGGSYWMSDNDGHLISASHNVTIKSGAGAYVSLLNPALHTMNAFVLGCGKRCGLRSDQDNSGEEKSYSPIGAASGSGSELFGRPYDEESRSTSSENKMSPKKALGINDPPSFSLGKIGNEIILPPYGTAELGPVYFRPPGRGDHKGIIYVENSLTGFEQVEVRGRGGWENLVFLDREDGDIGGDVEFRFGKSALVFPGTNKVGEKGPVVKSVRLANHGDVPVDISRIYMASSEVTHFTHKRPHPTSSFGNNAKSSGDSHEREAWKCSKRGFVLLGCTDSSHSNAWIQKIHGWLNDLLELFTESSSPDEQSARAEWARAFYEDGFTLQPNQTRSVYVLHYPDCTFQTSYASVIFEVGGRKMPTGRDRNHVGLWHQTFRKRRVELLVGYDMSASEFRNCVPYATPESSISIWERKIVFQLPTLLQDLLSFGLTRLTDANGNPYIPRRPIEVTLLAASFILLLFALSLDLIFTVEISAIRKSCPSWKPTCRCLARADPTSSDLVSIGKEQTKHVLLSRFKKESVLPANCILSDGSFRREKAGTGGTHSEDIFDRLKLAKESKKMADQDDEDNGAVLGVLPVGLGWRTAYRRGVGLPSAPKNEGPPELAYLHRTRDIYIKKLRERQNATPVHTVTPATSPSPMPVPPTKTHGSAGFNGHPHAVKPTSTAVAARPQPQDRKSDQPQIKKNHQDRSGTNGRNISSIANRPAPQSKPSDVGVVRSVAPKSASHASKPTSTDRVGGKVSTKVNKNAETGKQQLYQQKPNVTGSAPSHVAQADHKSIKDAETKGKAKQRNESKTSKKTETKKVTPKQEESSSKTKSAPGQKARSAKPALEVISSSGSSSKIIKQDDALTTSASPSRQATAQAKQRPTKKSTNGTKSAEQSKSNKQGKQKGASKKGTTKTNPPNSPMSTTGKSTNAKPARSDAEFPPLSFSAAPPSQPPTPNNRSKKEAPQQKANAVRPPPGLAAPPGFLDQPDLEGISNPSSPASSPQRLSSSSQRSPMVQSSLQQEPPSVDIIHSPPLMDNDLVSSLALMGGRGAESSLFAAQSSDNSPRSANGSGSALSIPTFHPQNFTPPTLEPSATAETNSSEAAAPADDVLTLLGAGSNFNVSNFLDGLGIKNEEPKAPESAPVHANPFGLSLDPWSSMDNPSRNSSSSNPLAALRGGEVASHQESPIIAGIPLNSNAPSLLATSSTLQTSATTASTFAEPAYASIASIVSDDGGGGEDDFLEPDSFYNQLLGEE